MFFVAVWPESPYRTRQMRGMLAKLPVDNLFVVEWLITRRVINRVLIDAIPYLLLFHIVLTQSLVSTLPTAAGVQLRVWRPVWQIIDHFEDDLSLN